MEQLENSAGGADITDKYLRHPVFQVSPFMKQGMNYTCQTYALIGLETYRSKTVE